MPKDLVNSMVQPSPRRTKTGKSDRKTMRNAFQAAAQIVAQFTERLLLESSFPTNVGRYLEIV
jgi:hypothetical protein